MHSGQGGRQDLKHYIHLFGHWVLILHMKTLLEGSLIQMGTLVSRIYSLLIHCS